MNPPDHDRRGYVLGEFYVDLFSISLYVCMDIFTAIFYTKNLFFSNKVQRHTQRNYKHHHSKKNYVNTWKQTSPRFIHSFILIWGFWMVLQVTKCVRWCQDTILFCGLRFLKKRIVKFQNFIFYLLFFEFARHWTKEHTFGFVFPPLRICSAWLDPQRPKWLVPLT